MTYLDFKNKYLGKTVDYDGAYSAQCWDLAQQYITECLGLPETIIGGCGLVNNLLKEPKITELLKYFDEVKTTEMVNGDLVIWEYGHIAIFDHWDGNVKKNYYLSQNPNPTDVIADNVGVGVHAFRVKKKQNELEKQIETLTKENTELKNKLKQINEITKGF